jgi:hypothetical protein
VGVPTIIKYLEQFETPTEVCIQIGMCLGFGDQTVKCEGCHLLIGAIESWIESNVTETAMIVYLDALCHLVPKYSVVCQKLVGLEIPEIIKYLEQYETPERVCIQLAMC